MDRVDVPEPSELRVTSVGLREVLGPVGVIVAESVTAPLKPLRLLRVMSDEAVDDLRRLREFGLAVIEKSETIMLGVMLWDWELLVPVT